MSILIDTSVWVDHFRNYNEELVKLIETDFALIHPMVLLELACATLPAPRTQTLDNIGLLRSSEQTSLHEVMDFIEAEKLFSLGCGLVDISLLTSIN